MTGRPLQGRVLSEGFARTVLSTMDGVPPLPTPVARRVSDLGERVSANLGPTSTARAVCDAAIVPLLETLGFRVGDRRDTPDEVRLVAVATGPTTVPIVVRPWTHELDATWRELVRWAIASDVRWCLACNGRRLQFVDAHRTWSRHVVDVDLAALAHDSGLVRVLWLIGCAQTLTAEPALLSRAAQLSAEHGHAVSRRLGRGVVRALVALFAALPGQDHTRLTTDRLLEECLTVVYRILFLMFAEARALVPIWNPIYRDRYTVGGMLTSLLTTGKSRGMWQAIQAMSRMAHTGCDTDAFSVNAFNGRLFSPAQTAGLDARQVPDDVMRTVVVSLGSTHESGHVVRTHFEDLDVEQLGAVYERVLEHQPTRPGSAEVVRTREVRKESGTFYTPRDLAAMVVRHTLEPLVVGRSADEILQLRVLDPAMGSGAFLVAACRYLAECVERALVAEGTWHVGEVTAADRGLLRREIVQRCLYGVDLNPFAVQLARLSLWLVGLARDKPLSFLDHHLLVGNSLVGATPSDLLRPTGGAMTRRAEHPLPLFDELPLAAALDVAGHTRVALSLEHDDTAQIVRSKEQRLASLIPPGSAIASWTRLLDLWCATWFWDSTTPPSRATVVDVASRVLTGQSALSAGTVASLLTQSDRCARRHRFLHWPLAFPEVFAGVPSDRPAGFDAVIGNPPWDMVRGDSGSGNVRVERGVDSRHLTSFVRTSGAYRAGARAHLNRYALFAERALQLVRPKGRLGLVLPFGVLTDAGMAPLRTHLLRSSGIDRLIGFDNRARIFPIHRSVRFVALGATAGIDTASIVCRFGVTHLDQLGSGNAGESSRLTRTFLERLSGGDDMSFPARVTALDLRILEKVSSFAQRLGDPAGWGVTFGRELNASDDRGLLVPVAAAPRGRPVVEGKLLTPFRVALSRCRCHLRPGVMVPSAPPRARLAYREVAGASNRLTLIAAVLPSRAVTTHSVFCLKTRLNLDAQHALCALLNSFVANYLVRMRVTTHVTAAIMAKLHVPLAPSGSEEFRRLVSLARALARPGSSVEVHPAFAEAQGLAARLYRLSEDEFAHVLGTFPLVPPAVRQTSLDAYGREAREHPLTTTSTVAADMPTPARF